MGEKIRIGLIGAGNICQNAHIPAYLKQEDVELVAVCDINEKRANEVKEKYGMRYAFTDFHDLVNLPDVDAVSVCTWNNSHAAATIAALKAGKHVLCEKPMAMNPEEAEAMIKAAEDSKRILQIGFVNRFKAESKLLKEFAEKGRFGDIYFAKATYERRRGTPTGWFTNRSKSGGGPVIDIGVHIIDLTWYLMGRPRPVSVTAAVYDRIGDYSTKGVSRWHAFDPDDAFDTEDSACAFIRFENGACMQVSVSWALNNKESMNSEIFGSKAGASLSPFVIYDEQENYLVNSTPVVDKEDPFYNEIKEFITCIREGKAPTATGQDGFQIQRILNGIYQSAKLGREVVL